MGNFPSGLFLMLDQTKGRSHVTESESSVAKLEFVQAELGRQLRAYRKRRKRDKRKAFGLKVSTVILSAAITVLLGLRHVGPSSEALFANIALSFGALATTLAAIDAFFEHRGLWILRTQTVRDLEAISRDVAFYESGRSSDPDPVEVAGLYAKLSDVIMRDNSEWLKLRGNETAAGAVS